MPPVAAPMITGAVWRTTAVRYGAILSLTFAAVLAVALTAIYISTVTVVERQMNAALEAEVRALSERYRDGGLGALVAAIEERVRPQNYTHGVYLLRDPTGRAVVGNLTAWPAEASRMGLVTFPVRRQDSTGVTDRRIAAQVFDLPNRFALLVGRDSEDLYAIRSRFGTVALWVAMGTVVFGLLSGLVLGRRVLARVQEAATTGERIAAGNLDRRVPVTGSGDEFDRLAASVNAMLDRIEALMAGMRLATDSIGHDVRRPLTRVRAELELALLRDSNADEARATIARAMEKIDGAVRVLGNLLDISRAEAGVLGGTWGPLALDEVVQDAVELYQPVAEERGIALTVETAPTPATGEPQLLAQAVVNLIDNALKYSPAGTGQVAVRVAPLPLRAAMIEVRDNGPGIPAEDRARVTERFVRLNDDARAGEGSGLGLSLVRAAARLHGGQLALEDAEPGLVARITLPG